jgi:L-ascorbate metabolism protein UlaG (beta-lactamase superfamily)
VLVALITVVVLSVAGGLVFVRTTPFGASPAGERQAVIERSPQWQDDEFTNPRPQWTSLWAAATGPLFDGSDLSSPDPPLDIAATDTGLYDVPPVAGLRITWFGHASTLVEIDRLRVLLDPFWGEHSGPSELLGLEPFYPAPAALSDLGSIDAVLISHDHWDHLDHSTVEEMVDWPDTLFVVPLGIGAHLERWGIAPERIRELDWWDGVTVGSVELVPTPARHSSGRDPLRSNETLWSGWALVGPQHRAWYSGDSAYFPELAEIGERLGPFDVTLVNAGQYDPSWVDNHLGPELAVEASVLAGGELVIPVHWGLIDLAPHSWTEPVERVVAEARCREESHLVLVPGVPTEPTAAAVADQEQWWPDLPWRTAEETPLNPTVDGDLDQRVDITPCVLGGP